MPEAWVKLKGLQIDARVRGRTRTLVQGVGLELEPGHATVLLGASGSGKTLTVRSMLGLVLARPGITAGQLIVHDGERLHKPLSVSGRARERAFEALRGGVIGYLPQDARAALNPVWTVGRQVQEALSLAGRPSAPEPWLERAGLKDAARVRRLYPHQLSGGMAQRACIALALARGSRFLLADEPTTGLDPTVREGILRELIALKQQGVGLLFITHDLRLVPRIGDRVLVLHGGRVVDQAPADRLGSFRSPEAQALWDATRRISGGIL